MLTNFARMLNNRKRGFTIIELVIVIAIIGILSAVLIPNFSSTLTKADSAAKAANLNSVNKIAASAKVVAANGPMLDVTGAVVSNFGKEAAAKTLKTTVYNAETQSFTALTKVKVDDASKPDRTLYYPVYGDTYEEASANLKAYDFVEYYAGTPELAKGISKKIANTSMKNQSGEFREVYVINGSIALHSDLELADALFIFLDGASLETNGNAFKCHSVAFVDTSADGQTPVTFKVYGGNVLPEYSFGVLNVKNFYAEDGSINWTAAAQHTATTAITIYMGGTIALNTPDYAGMYLNVDNLCAIVSGVISMAPGSQATLDGETKLVVEDGGAILPANTQGHDLAAETTLVYVDFKAESGNTQIECKDGSFTSLAINGENPVSVNGNTSSGGAKFFTIDPPTAANCAATALAQTAHAVALAGGNVDCMMTIIESAGNAMVDTAAAICDGLGATAAGTTAAIVSQADVLQVAGMVNAMKTDVVSTAIASASASTTGAISAAIGTVTLSNATATPGASGTSIVSTMQAYNTCDTSWYDASKSSFEISTPAQLYGLSTLVFNGVTSFYGKTITLANDIDLDAYKPWLPIGNGQYGFRGTFDGNGKTIKNMHLDVNKTWVMMSIQGKGWNNTSYRAAKEGTAFGYQNGDKYGIGFIGVLENGGELKNVTFSACNVGFDYNWNSYAAVAVGAIRATGEDYSYDGNGYTNAGKFITGFTNGIAQYGDSANASLYADKGYAYNGATYAEQNATRLASEKNKGYTATTDLNSGNIPFKSWVTKITGVTVDETCSVYATGRCGSVCAVIAGVYYTNPSYNDGKIESGPDAYSIFAGWGTVQITQCVNKGSVTHIPTKDAYEEAGGIVGYSQVLKNATASISHCSNEGAIKGGAAAGIFGSTNSGPITVDTASCTNTGTISIADTNRAGVKLHTGTVASTLYNTTVTAVGAGSTKLN